MQASAPATVRIARSRAPDRPEVHSDVAIRDGGLALVVYALVADAVPVLWAIAFVVAASLWIDRSDV
jgi:hypothetical protein